jgi:hypothetical protein
MTWMALFDRQPSLGIGEPGALAVDPNNSDTIYVGTTPHFACCLLYLRYFSLIGTRQYPDDIIVTSNHDTLMLNPNDALSILTKGKFSPIKSGEHQLTLRNFNELSRLPLSPGSEIDIEGFITHVSHIRGRDADIHFNLSSDANDEKNFVVCEIQNADNDAHGMPLKNAFDNQEKVMARGVLRLFLEHIHEIATQPTLPHIFELHPVRKVVIGGNNGLPDITMDCPDKEGFRSNESVHQIELQDDGTITKDGQKLRDNIQVRYDGTNLTFFNPPPFNVNYAYTRAYFSKTQDGEFPDGKPYSFELKKSPAADSIGIESVALPDTPAYNILKEFHNNPPDEALTVAILRSLNMQALMKSNYKIMFCPVYRIERNAQG